METLGKQIKVPGTYWGGRMTTDELETLYYWCVRSPCARAPHARTLIILNLI